MITGAVLLIAFIYFTYRKNFKSSTVPTADKNKASRVSESMLAGEEIVNTELGGTKGIDAIDTSNISNNEAISIWEGEATIYAEQVMPPPPAYTGPMGGPYTWGGIGDPPDGIFKITYIYP